MGWFVNSLALAPDYGCQMDFQIPERRGLANKVGWTVLHTPSFGEELALHTVEGIELNIHSREHRQCARRRHTAIVWITFWGNLNAITVNVNNSISLDLYSRPMLKGINQFLRTRKNFTDSVDGTSTGVSVVASDGMTGVTPETVIHGP